MQPNTQYCQPDLYYSYLHTIKGIKFTRRQVDILACLATGRDAKTIASFLQIESERTVHAHELEIRRRLECGSRNDIINFLEQCEEYSILKKHHQILRTHFVFDKMSKAIKSLLHQQYPNITIIYEGFKEKKLASIVKSLEYYLIQTGIKISFQKKDILQHLDASKSETSKHNLVYIPSEATLLNIQKVKETNNANKFLKEPSPLKLNSSIFIVLNAKQIPYQFKDLTIIDFRDMDAFYLNLFELLKNLLPNDLLSNIEFIKVETEFRKEYEAFLNGKQTIIINAKESFPYKTQHKHIWSNYLKENKNWIIISFLLTGILSGWLISRETRPKDILHTVAIARSDLIIPTESTLLKRDTLIKQIEQNLNQQKGIQTVALIGMGGVGKTTLARQFGRSYDSSLVWELNAETKDNLMNSFKDLACVITKTKEEKEELESIKSIQNAEEREKQLISFVRDHLKTHSNWLLIYDNADTFTDVKDYLPHDYKVWGNGKVIITTRNSNIHNTSYISSNNIIQLGELSQIEALTLFSKILYNFTPDKLTPEQKGEAIEFLKLIPPFPLDISVTAYYIKSTQINYEKYLENLKNDEGFEGLQEQLLKELTGYEKTRYRIITMTLKKLIEIDNNFLDLLLFIGLLDSQNIPINLLQKYKSASTVGNLIYNLKKYSLITNNSENSPFGLVFSIHRSTHTIMLDYFKKVLNLEKNPQLIQPISIIIENYVNNIIKKVDLAEMKFFTSHCEMFLSHNNLISVNSKLLIKGDLGYVFYYLRDDIKAKKFLEESLEYLNPKDYKTSAQVAQILIYLGNINMELGDHQKAKKLLDKVLVLHKDYLSKDHIDVARSLAFMGDIYVHIGEYHKAKKLLEQSIRIFKKCQDDEIGFARALGFMGNVYIYLGEYVKAKQTLELCLQIYKKHFPEAPIGFAWVFVYLGNAYVCLGEYEKAKSFLEESVKIYKENFPEIHADTAWAMLYLADVYIKMKNYTQAEKIINKSLHIHKKLFEKGNVRIAEALLRLGNLYMHLGQNEKSKELLEEVIQIDNEIYGKHHIKIVPILINLGEVYLLQDNLKEAEEILGKALEICRENEYNYPIIYMVFEGLANLNIEKAKQSLIKKDKKLFQYYTHEALINLRNSLETVNMNFPETCMHKIRIQEKIERLQSNK